MVSLETQSVLAPCSSIESITPANLLKFYMKPVYEAQYHFQVHERILRMKMKEFKMHFKDFFAHIPSKNTKLSKDAIQIYEGKPIWEAIYHLQVTESSLRSRVKTLKLDLWRSSSASVSTSTYVSTYAYANPKDLLQSLLEGKGWNYGIVWDKEGSCLKWNTGYIAKEQPEMMPSDTPLEELSFENSLNDRRENVFLKLSGFLSCENIQELVHQSLTDVQWFYLFSMFESVSVSESIASKMLCGEAFLLSKTNNLFYSGWDHAQDAASFGLKTLILISCGKQQVVELGSKDIISETTLDDSVKKAKAFFKMPVSGRNLKRKAVVEDDDDDDDLEFKVMLSNKLYTITISKDGISFEKVQQSIAQALTLQSGTFALQYACKELGDWLMLESDHHLMTCIESSLYYGKVLLRVESNMPRLV